MSDFLEMFRTQTGWRYENLTSISEGAFGSVYRAQDRDLGIPVAIKFPKLDAVPEERRERTLENFRKEAQALARLHHPQIIRVFDVRLEDPYYWLIMAWAPGRPLSDVTQPIDDWARAFRKIALGLDAAHRIGVIHRDLKPANIMLDPQGEPIVVDFGLAYDLREHTRLFGGADLAGTLEYMAPEQFSGEVSPRSDIYSLGVTLYHLLTNVLPYPSKTLSQLMVLLMDPSHTAPPPGQHRPDLDPRLDAIIVKAIAKRPEDRFASMADFADALEQYLQAKRSGGPVGVRPEEIRFDFVGYGAHVAENTGRQDMLYLEVGGACRAGVIDQHQGGGAQSTTALVLQHPEHIADAVSPWRRVGDPFTIFLHHHPDLDALAAGYLAAQWLTTGHFPPHADQLAAYTSRIDRGERGFSLDQPFSLYAAVMLLAHDIGQRHLHDQVAGWRELTIDALKAIDYCVSQLSAATSIESVDAFATPGLFRPRDRAELLADRDRYVTKLKEIESQARKTKLALPTPTGGQHSVWALLARDVMNLEDPDRCVFFKDWARNDARHCPEHGGFVALSVYISATATRPARAILSVRPDAGVTLAGLGSILEQAERQIRHQQFGRDDRLLDPQTGAVLPCRVGYDHPDPWYDGRGHDFTIIDAPRAGTILSADQIETLFRRFGKPPQ